jgi:hypothetical protein
MIVRGIVCALALAGGLAAQTMSDPQFGMFKKGCHIAST